MTTYNTLVKKCESQQRSIARSLEKAGFHIIVDDSRLSESRYVTVSTFEERKAHDVYDRETNSFGPEPREFKIRISAHENRSVESNYHVDPMESGDWRNAVAAAKKFFA